MNRRQFNLAVAGAGIAATGAALSSIVGAKSAAKIVVIGGGPAGATVACDLKRRVPGLDVTLIEPNKRYTTCFFSNHYIGGLRSFRSITHDYRGLRQLGVTVRQASAREIDPQKKTIRFGQTGEMIYDYLVVAPGISMKFDGIEGYSEAAAKMMPHAWQGGVQSKLLRRRLEAMEDGGTVVIVAPRMPYRCPPGPYERACLIANYLKAAKPKSKLIILDPKFSYSKQPVFEEAFDTYYKDVIEVHLSNDIDDFSVSRVDARTGEIATNSGLTVKASVASIIPDQRAGEIAHRTGLSEGDWCPVDPASFRSNKAQDTYVLGDAAIADAMPKSAFSAHNQAKFVVAHLLTELDPRNQGAAQLRNTCWSMVAPDDSVKIGADYNPGEVNGEQQLIPQDSFVSQPGEDAALRRENYADSLAWYETLTSEIYPEYRR